MKKVFGAILGLSLLTGIPAKAQLGNLGGLMGGTKKASGDVDGVITSGTRIIVFETIATDLAVTSAMQMLEAFPPSKVKHIQKSFLQYNEIKAKRGKDDQLDATSIDCSTKGFTAMAELAAKDYQAGNDKVIRSAYLKLGLALGADTLAASQLPPFVSSTNGAISSLSSNPMQANKLVKLQAIAATTAVLAKAVPTQVKAITTVRALAKTIAEAHGIKLGEPKTLASMDPVALAAEVKTVEVS